MPKEWYLMDANTYFSGGEIDNFNNYANTGFSELLMVSPEAEDVLIQGVPKRVIVQNTMTENIKLITVRYMLSHIGDSRGGYYVDFRNDKWLILAKPDNNKMYEKSVIQKCNHNLKWINNNNELIQKPCIASSKTLYTPGIKNEKVIEVPDGMWGIQLPYDDDTQNLNIKQCFVFNKSKYEVTFYNEVEYDGLIVLICKEIELNESRDDIENEIADRWDVDGNDRLEQADTEPENPKGFTYSIEGEDEIMWNLTETYVVKKYNNGIEVDGKFTFELEGEVVDITSYTDNTVDIKARSNIYYEYATLKVTDVDTGEIITKQILIKGLI